MATEFTPLSSTVGGLMIGAAALVMMLGLGRVAGVSGIFASLLTLKGDQDFTWRAAFILGILGGASLAAAGGVYDPASVAFPAQGVLAAVSGFIVGVGTALGGGCTSGHGICGLSRLSPRSLVATITFMLVALIVVFVTRHML
jgi:uncharacterized membrane protein YedE/YeeE